MELFNPHASVTSNGKLVTEGLRVRDYNWDEGVVESDNTAAPSRCCMTVHSTSQAEYGGQWMMSPEKRAAAVTDGCYCGHDHWFIVALDDGRKSYMNGERLLAL